MIIVKLLLNKDQIKTDRSEGVVFSSFINEWVDDEEILSRGFDDYKGFVLFIKKLMKEEKLRGITSAFKYNEKIIQCYIPLYGQIDMCVINPETHKVEYRLLTNEDVDIDKIIKEVNGSL